MPFNRYHYMSIKDVIDHASFIRTDTCFFRDFAGRTCSSATLASLEDRKSKFCCTILLSPL